MVISVSKRAFNWLSFDILVVYMWLIVFFVFSLEKCGKIWKNLLFFWVSTAGLGKYRTCSYGQIWV